MSQRLLSLDVFRGLTMAAMVVVNNNGGPAAYAQLHHSKWHGVTFTDLVFPSFLWIVGVAMILSTARRLEQGASRGELMGHALRRFLWIFGIALFISAFPWFDLANLRILGVLQRIAICYLISTAVYIYLGTRGVAIVAALCLVVYTAVMHPGGYEREANFSNWLDSVALGAHNYKSAKTWDPEGIFSTLPAISTCLLGILTGVLLRSKYANKVTALLGGGAVLMAAGLALDAWQPMNKPIWTPTYALFTAGLAMAVFGLLYWRLDVQGGRHAWTWPLAILGMNAFAVYIFHGQFGALVRKLGWVTPMLDFWGGFLSPAGACLAYSLTHLAASFVFAWALYQRRWFLKF